MTYPTSIRKEVRIPLLQGEVSADILTFNGLKDGAEHIAIGLGNWKSIESPLVRVHSECLTGDVFGSAKCDCGPQLNESIKALHNEGGVILYLRQEGRGIGLYNKIDTYDLQQKGLDTFEANRELNFPDDLRDFSVAADMLKSLNYSHVRLLTNNPDKKSQLETNGIVVDEMVGTGVFLSDHNRHYLAAKVNHSNHKINIPD